MRRRGRGLATRNHMPRLRKDDVANNSHPCLIQIAFLLSTKAHFQILLPSWWHHFHPPLYPNSLSHTVTLPSTSIYRLPLLTYLLFLSDNLLPLTSFNLHYTSYHWLISYSLLSLTLIVLTRYVRPLITDLLHNRVYIHSRLPLITFVHFGTVHNSEWVRVVWINV